jgi:hypothetical protein
MTAITINLSDAELMRVRQEAAKKGFTGIEDYLHELVAESLKNEGEETEDYGAPEDLQIRSKEQLRELIREGAESPKHVMTKEDWAQMRRELVERHGPRKE